MVSAPLLSQHADMMVVVFGPADDDAVLEVIDQMHGVTNAAMRVLLAAVVEAAQRETWRLDGAHSMPMWLQMRHGIGHDTARRWVRVARGLVFGPELAERFGAGRLSWDQLVPAVELVAYGTGDDASVAEEAVGRTAAELDRLAREARMVSRAAALARETPRHPH